MYFVIKYENNNTIQPLIVVMESETLEIAREKAYSLALDIYGLYVEDFKNINDPKIKQNFLKFRSLYDYSDWAINLDGTFDNIVFSVIEPKIL